MKNFYVGVDEQKFPVIRWNDGGHIVGFEYEDQSVEELYINKVLSNLGISHNQWFYFESEREAKIAMELLETKLYLYRIAAGNLL